MNPIESIRAKVIEAVPEIVELKRGCVLESKDYEYDDNRHFTIAAHHGMCLKHKTDRGCEEADGNCDPTDGYTLIAQGGIYDDWGYIRREVPDEKLHADYRILGRLITLADVLLAMSRGIMVDRNGIFYDMNPKPLNIGRAWNLEGSLYEQTPETLEFISKLLNISK